MSRAASDDSLALLLSPLPTTLEKSLADKLLESFEFSTFHDPPRKYLPASTIKKLITQEAIEKELRKIEEDSLANRFDHSFRRNLATWILARAPKIFAICVTLELGARHLLSAMILFQKHEFVDKCLPLKDPQDSPPDQQPFHPAIWTSAKLEDFYEKQWRYLAPIFSPSKYNYNLLYNDTFPFIKDNAGPKVGAFGSVCRVTIHPDHRKYENMENVAIKEIVVTRGNDKAGTNNAWDTEARALAHINKLNHPHITNCIAAIRRGDSRYFMFPWAEGGSLRDFWDEVPKQIPTAELISETVHQLRGIADALDSLHNCQEASLRADASADGPDEQLLNNPDVLVYDEDDGIIAHVDNVNQRSIRHGDLKPENILRFMDKKTKLGTLKIADMGLAKQHIVNTQDRKQLTSTRYGTIQYEAPEAVITLKGGRSRLYDIWSMGCITLEFIIWVLYGNDVLNNFYGQVKGDAQQAHRYFEIPDPEEVQRTGLRARVHPVVLHWMEYLQNNDPECSRDSAMRDLLKIVREKLLVINLPVDRASAREGGRMLAPPALGETEARYRATAAQFRDALDEILHKINLSKKNGSGYHFTAIGRANLTVPKSQARGPNLVVPGTILGTPASPRVSEMENVSSTSPGMLLTGVRDRSTRVADYTLPPLKDWEFIVDNKFVDDLLLPKVGYQALSPQSSRPAKLCDRCTTLNFWEGGFTLSDSLHALENRAEQCDFCKLLFSCKPEEDLGSRLIQVERKQSTLVPTGSPFPTLSIFRTPGLRTPAPIQIGLPELPDPRSDAFFQILGLWLADCDLNHDCRGAIHDSLPTRLIDVGTDEEMNLRLVETREEQIATRKYIALSHPWGDTNTYKPFSTLRKDPSGAGHELDLFKQSIPYDQLPATFKDAVYCTRKLGVRYLWIDSICIIQGKDGDFTEEAKRMEDVFSGAYCVLAASRANNQYSGFLGHRQQREYVTFKRGAEKDNPFYVCKMADDFNKDVIEGPFNKRGWVLQERALARRTIYFTENQTYFECGNGIRCETLTRMHNNMSDFLGDARFPEKAMRTDSRALKIEYFQDLYRLYSRLQFTRYEDKPFAVAGLEKRLLAAFGTKGGYGIFDDGDRPDGGLFHRSLLWRRGDEILTPIEFPAERDIQVPSWSWMAYRGGIDYTDPPYRSADWEKNEIQPPWTRGDIKDTDSGGQVALAATVRDFTVAGRKENEVNLTYDTETTTGSDGQRAQCVIVAKSTVARSDRERVYYVLLVAPTRLATECDEKAYKRIGAGTMLGKFINLDGLGIQAKVY